MNWEVIIGIISIIISIFTLLFFSIYPYIKKTMINKSFIRIENFYNLYSYLNPCFLYTLDGTKNYNNKRYHVYMEMTDKKTIDRYYTPIS